MADCLLQVTSHLSKLFDNMSDLEFSKTEQQDNTKLAVGMYSKEREYVPFQTECHCYGPVRSGSVPRTRISYHRTYLI